MQERAASSGPDRLPMTPPPLPFSLGFLSKQLVGQENKAQGRKLDPENKLGFLY